jgi:hypothetical protein
LDYLSVSSNDKQKSANVERVTKAIFIQNAISAKRERSN